MATSASATNGQPAFNSKELSAHMKQNWISVLDRCHDPKLPKGEKPEMFKVPGVPGGGAWGSGAGAWSRPANNPSTMADGQQFLIGLGKALDQHNNKSAKK